MPGSLFVLQYWASTASNTGHPPIQPKNVAFEAPGLSHSLLDTHQSWPSTGGRKAGSQGPAILEAAIL